MVEKFVEIDNVSGVTGVYDRNLRLIENSLGVNLFIENGGVLIKGKDSKSVKQAGELLNGISYQGVNHFLSEKIVNQRIRGGKNNTLRNSKEAVKVFSKKRFVYPQTQGQKQYIAAIKKYDLTFSVGPAGTGKTYLAMALAVESLAKNTVQRIILTRPAIEAGESLGFLPGNLNDKLGPYLRPLYDALYDMLEINLIEDYLERGIIEVAPLAYMRGRTLNNAFIILDEAQNCTLDQLKMFLTRLGFNSKAVVTGDVTQSDLPGRKPLGLIDTVSLLKPVKKIGFVNLTGQDVVRHELVQRIIEAYDKFEKK